MGSFSLKKQFRKELEDAGVEVLEFQPVGLSPKALINYRNHRKILVIDGKTGFVGGVNIADRYYYGTSVGEWHDTHIKIKGESVFSLQACFLMDRHFIRSRKAKSIIRFKKKYYPPLDIKGSDARIKGQHLYSQIISSGPDSFWSSIMQCYFSAITAAKKHIYIVTPYFTPCETILNALKISALGEVDVRIMLPERSDTKIAHWSTMSYISELLEAGIKIYLFKKGFNHSKVISIDGQMSIVGSANMDMRSFEHNFEVMAAIYNAECAGTIEQRFLEDLKQCRQITAGTWSRRGVSDKIKESFARLWSPLL
jgi:cardiolipin synthase